MIFRFVKRIILRIIFLCALTTLHCFESFKVDACVSVNRVSHFTKLFFSFLKMWLQFLLCASILINVQPSGIFEAKMLDNELNINDILRTDLMPSHFFMKSDISEDTADAREEMDYDIYLGRPEPSIMNGSIDAALSTLSFHRWETKKVSALGTCNTII